jgi:hypothetical protein
MVHSTTFTDMLNASIPSTPAVITSPGNTGLPGFNRVDFAAQKSELWVFVPPVSTQRTVPLQLWVYMCPVYTQSTVPLQLWVYMCPVYTQSTVLLQLWVSAHIVSTQRTVLVGNRASLCAQHTWQLTKQLTRQLARQFTRRSHRHVDGERSFSERSPFDLPTDGATSS